MRKMLAAVIFVVSGIAAPALASCDEETIETVSEDGDLIVLSNGISYDVLGGDEVTAALWLPGTEVVVCDDDTMLNKDDGEKIDVMPH